MDRSRAEHEWDASNTPIHPVLDEDGVNMANGQIRVHRWTTTGKPRCWLYADDVDGFKHLADRDRRRLTLGAGALNGTSTEGG